jgi:hypothetical protein
MDGFIALCAVLGKVRTVRLADCGLGASSGAELSKTFSDADADMGSVNCLANHFGDEGLATLLTAIEGTSVRSLCGLTEGETTADFSGQNLSPIDCKILAAEYDFRGFIAASVEVIKLYGNPIGYPSKVNLKPGAETGVAVKKGVFAAVDGRFGEVTRDPNSDQEVKLRWLVVDDGSQSSYTKADKLTEVVASRSDLIEEYPHIQALGEAISGSQVKQVSLAECQFTSATLTTFVQSVRWDTAALTELDLRENKALDEAALAELRAAAPKTCKILTD